jgi:predicted nucleic-acid-binding Zn-ribbon protein
MSEVHKPKCPHCGKGNVEDDEGQFTIPKDAGIKPKSEAMAISTNPRFKTKTCRDCGFVMMFRLQ